MAWPVRLGLGVVLFGGVYAVAAAQEAAVVEKKPPYEEPVKVAEGVWFEKHNDVPSHGSNVAWIEFADFVVVVDTAYPRGAERALKNIRGTTKGKPVRYAVVTHHHGDHAFGSGVFAKDGAIIVAHENARREYMAKNIKSYADKVAKDPSYAGVPAAPPQVTFQDKMIIDDGKGRRAELFHFGAAHTSGDIFTFLPSEKIVFTGDACVNGDHNFMGDGDTRSWIEVLGKVQALAPAIVVPGHGALGKFDLLETQKQYFVELRRQVAALIKQGKGVEEAKTLVDIPAWKQWTGKTEMKPAAIAQVYKELSAGDPRAGAPAGK